MYSLFESGVAGLLAEMVGGCEGGITRPKVVSVFTLYNNKLYLGLYGIATAPWSSP
jgi:hypothetical protein